MYLNDWPQKYESVVHILKQTHLTLAPWNVSHVAETRNGLDPVFYHFHGLRFVSPKNVRLYTGYRINEQAQQLYDRYLEQLRASVEILKATGIPIKPIPLEQGIKPKLIRLIQKCRGLDAFVTIDH